MPKTSKPAVFDGQKKGFWVLGSPFNKVFHGEKPKTSPLRRPPPTSGFWPLELWAHFGTTLDDFKEVETVQTIDLQVGPQKASPVNPMNPLPLDLKEMLNWTGLDFSDFCLLFFEIGAKCFKRKVVSFLASFFLGGEVFLGRKCCFSLCFPVDLGS